MNERNKLRIVPGAGGVSVWSSDLFSAAGAPLREFLARAFAVQEVETVEIRRADAFGRLRYAPASNPDSIWRKLGAALRGVGQAEQSGVAGRSKLGVDALYLDHPGRWPIRVGRVGNTLSTWRVRPDGEGQLRLAHPILRSGRGFTFRLEEQLAGIFGVEDFRARAFSSDVLIRFDPRSLTPERLVRELEKAWPALIDGSDEPPSNKRLFAAGSLLTLAAVGQFAVPALRPVAVGAVVIYSAPNVVAAVKQLRHGEVGLPAMYSLGLGMMLASGLPLTGTIMASLMQLWPYLTHRTLVNRQRRLFAAHRRRPVWARVEGAGGAEIEVHVDDLKPGDEVAARAGDVVPVDGVVIQGLAVVADAVAGAAGGLRDVAVGDEVFAGATVREGELTIRVVRAGDATAAAHVGAALPYSAFRNIPSMFEAERVANRNARPALALAALNLLTIRAPRFSQAVIRPDYVTAPRLSAQLTALHDLADGLRRGILIRRPAVLDLLKDIDVVAFDDGAGLDRRGLEVARIESIEGGTDEALAYASIAVAGDASERALAIASHAARRPPPRPAPIRDFRRNAGGAWFRDAAGQEIAVVAPAYLDHAGIALPPKLKSGDGGDAESPPLYVLRDGRPVAVIRFRRQGAPESRSVLAALKRWSPRVRLVHLSSRKQSIARAVADTAGIEFAYGGLDGREKASALRGLGARTIWVGDGSAEGAEAVMTASDVSVSVSGFSAAPDDQADVLSLGGGLSGLVELCELADAHRARLKSDYRAVYAANLVGVAGAALANFGSLQAGLLSNLGSGVVYASHVRRLNGLISQIEKERGRLAG